MLGPILHPHSSLSEEGCVILWGVVRCGDTTPHCVMLSVVGKHVKVIKTILISVSQDIYNLKGKIIIKIERSKLSINLN